jgi:hypothetical protein
MRRGCQSCAETRGPDGSSEQRIVPSFGAAKAGESAGTLSDDALLRAPSQEEEWTISSGPRVFGGQGCAYGPQTDSLTVVRAGWRALAVKLAAAQHPHQDVERRELEAVDRALPPWEAPSC